jgi:hypothetical protein
MHNLRVFGDEHPIFYSDEIWVDQNHLRNSIRQDLTGKGNLIVLFRKSSRIIVHQIGSAKTGFILESKWVFYSCPQFYGFDYHSEKKADSFIDWFLNRFLNYLEEQSINFMDNTSYHSAVMDKVSNSKTHGDKTVD